MEKTKKGIWINQELIDNLELDWINKILLSEIQSLSKLELGCIISNESLGKLLNIHSGNISKRLSWLNDNGYINIVLKKKELKKTQRTIYPTGKVFAETQEGLSVNASRSKRERTEDYAETHEGVSVNASRSKRERSTTNTTINSINKSINNSINNSLINNTEKKIILYGIEFNENEVNEEINYRDLV